MGTGTDAMTVKATPGPDRTHMRSGMDATVADTGAGPDDRAGMTASRDAVTIQFAARGDMADMRAGMDAAVADTGAGPNHRTGMTARGDTMLVNAGARADAADMSTRANTFAADMRTDTDAQNIDLGTHGKGRDGREDGQHKDRGGEHFHRNILSERRTETDGPD
jgi:hypothetical protein